MPNFNHDISFMKQLDPSGRLEAFAKAAMNAINRAAAQVSASPVGTTAAPNPVASLTVDGGGGFHDITIHDSPSTVGVNYFVEWDTSSQFSNPRPVFLGPVRQLRTNLGVNGPVFFRAFPQHQTSDPASPTYFGTAQSPTGVDAGATTELPAIATTTGSGTEPSLLPQGAAGFGFNGTATGRLSRLPL